jgi:hypothetical protein
MWVTARFLIPAGGLERTVPKLELQPVRRIVDVELMSPALSKFMEDPATALDCRCRSQRSRSHDWARHDGSGGMLLRSERNEQPSAAPCSN